MPELPEVETVCNALRKTINQQRVTQVTIRCHSLRWPISTQLKTILLQHAVQSITRRSKYIIINFDHGHLIIHLGMSGSIRLLTKPLPFATTHDHIEILFSNHITLRYRDPRRFGAVLWTTDPSEEHSLLRNIGPEPLTSAFDGNYLLHQTQKRNINIKSLIMNSQIVAGVGNIYASEALFLAGIHPLHGSKTLTLNECTKLSHSIKQVLEQAIAAGGTTLNDFYQSDGKPGYFSQQLRVYARTGQPCLRCQHHIQNTSINQRNSFYCPNCQQ